MHMLWCTCAFSISLAMFLCFFSWSCLLSRAHSLDFDPSFPDKVSEGKQLYKELVEKSESYGDCWKTAMTDLRVGCKKLTEEIQSRMALSFSSCFLTHAGFEPCPCSPDASIAVCLQKCDDRVFNTYREFFTHTQSICHYLQHREWQEESSRTVLLLTRSSQQVSRKLDESARAQSKILELQQAGLSQQKRLISHSRVLNAELQQSRNSARDLYKEFKTTTEEQNFLLFQVFDRVKDLQNFVLGEFSGVYTVAYYIVAIILIYILTSVPRTAEARIWGMLIISLNAALERYLATQSLQMGGVQQGDLQGMTELIYSQIWLCRKVMCLTCFVLLLVTYYRYKDYNAINNKLLEEIRLQNKELQHFIQGMKVQKNVESFSMSSSNSTSHTVVLCKPEEGRSIAKPGIVGNGLSKSGLSKPRQVLSPKNTENKENTPLSPPQVVDLKVNLKKHPRKVTPSQKKKNQSNTSTVSSHEESFSSELESPVNQRYNLRRSSRLNSPQYSPLQQRSSPLVMKSPLSQ